MGGRIALRAVQRCEIRSGRGDAGSVHGIAVRISVPLSICPDESVSMRTALSDMAVEWLSVILRRSPFQHHNRLVPIGFLPALPTFDDPHITANCQIGYQVFCLAIIQ